MNSLWCASHVFLCARQSRSMTAAASSPNFTRSYKTLVSLVALMYNIQHNYSSAIHQVLLQVGIYGRPDLITGSVNALHWQSPLLAACPPLQCFVCIAFAGSYSNLGGALIGQGSSVLIGDSCVFVQKACCDAYQILISVITSDEQHW